MPCLPPLTTQCAILARRPNQWPPATFRDAVGDCRACPTNCSNCTSATACTACSVPNVLSGSACGEQGCVGQGLADLMPLPPPLE